MRLAMPFRRPFEALEEGLREIGCDIQRECQPYVDAVIVDFCDAVRDPQKTWALRRQLGGSTPLVAIARDAPWHKGVKKTKLWLCSLFMPFDIFATHSMQGAERFGKTTLYFPNAARISEYGLGQHTLESMRDPNRFQYQVSFIGNIDASRYPEHRKRCEFLTAIKSRLARERISLELFDSAKGIPPMQQVNIIQNSLINLNHGAACDQGGAKSWGLPERCYGIPACGGFMLSDKRQHASSDFSPAEEWADYDDIESCLTQIRFYLNNPVQARRIAEAAHARVMNCHTYRHRATTLVDSICAWKTGS